MIKLLLTLILLVLLAFCGFFVYNILQLGESQITGRVVTGYVESVTEDPEVEVLRKEVKNLEEEINNYKEIIQGEISGSEKVLVEKISREYETFSFIEGTKDLNPVVLLYDLEPSQIAEQDNTVIKVRPGVSNYEELYRYIRNSDIATIIIQENWRIDEATNLRRATGVSIIVKFAQGANGQMVENNIIEPLEFNAP